MGAARNGSTVSPPADADEAACIQDNVLSALSAELARLRAQIDQVSFENRLLWQRVMAQEAPSLEAVPRSERGTIAWLKGVIQSHGIARAVEEAERIRPEISARTASEIFRMLSSHAFTDDADLALNLARRAFEILPNGAVARQIVKYATPSRDLLSRSEADRYLLMNGGTDADAGRRLDRHWRDVGNLTPLRSGIREATSGIPYPAPVFGRVLMGLHSSLPHVEAGYSFRSHGLLTSLKHVGADVYCCTRLGFPGDLPKIVARDRDAGLPDQDEVEGITYHRLQTPPDIGKGRMPLGTYLQNYAVALQHVIRKQRIHIVHTASNYVNAVAGAMAAADARRPFIYEVRGFWELTRASGDPDFASSFEFERQTWLEAEAYRQAARVVTLTGPMRDELVQRGLEPRRITIVRNGVDVDQFTPTPKDASLAEELGLSDAPTVGYVGSFAAYEGLDDLLRAFGLLKQAGVRFNGLLVGDGATFRELQELAAELDLLDVVKLTGRVPHGKVSQYYSLIDITPFPRKPVRVCELVSPMKPFEAMAMSKAVLVSSVAALAEIVEDNVTGLIFEKGSVGSLASYLRLLIENGDLRERLGRQSHAWVREHRTWKGAARILKDLYEEVATEWTVRKTLALAPRPKPAPARKERMPSQHAP